MPAPKIAIIGAGPAGCMLARILHLSEIDVTVFESDPSPNYRSQGGSLDLHPKTGLAGIQDGKLVAEIHKVMRLDGDFYIMGDKHLNAWVKTGPSGGGNLSRPEVDRSDLRQILAESLPEGMIRWGYRLQQLEDDGRSLVFKRNAGEQGEQGSDHLIRESGFDLVVGCDGAWSKVRNFLSTTKPIYSGICYHTLRIPNGSTTAPNVHKLINGGNVFCHAEGQFMSIQQLNHDQINIGFSFTTRRQSHQPDEDRPDDEHWLQKCGYDVKDAAQVKRALLDGPMRDWSPKLREAVEKAEEGEDAFCDSRYLHRLPTGFRWDHRRGVTIVGDAAHVMLPFTGEGVNAALNDARRLAKGIIDAVSSTSFADELDGQVKKLEEEMFSRMESDMTATAEVTELLFYSDDVKEAFPLVMAAHLKQALPRFLSPLARPLMRSIWFCMKMMGW